jgi:hypothetical protein
LKIRPESYGWLSAASIEVNQAFNYCNEVSWLAATRTDSKRKWLSGFDLCSLTAGAAQYFERIGAGTIQRICVEYAQKRVAAKRRKLRWRVSRGARRSLGWVPFTAAGLKRKGRALRFCGKTFRVFEAERLEGVKWKQGCFAQDALGDWWLCLPVECTPTTRAAPDEWVGIDLGVKETAVTSEGERLEGGRYYRSLECKIAHAQRRGHRRQAKRLHRKAARRRADALHKFTRRIVDQYDYIVVGNVSSASLAKTGMGKSILDSGWGMLKRMLQYKGEYALRHEVAHWSMSKTSEQYLTLLPPHTSGRAIDRAELRGKPKGRSIHMTELGEVKIGRVNATESLIEAPLGLVAERG